MLIHPHERGQIRLYISKYKLYSYVFSLFTVQDITTMIISLLIYQKNASVCFGRIAPLFIEKKKHLQEQERHIFVVPHKSYLSACQRWKTLQKQPISAYKGAESLFFELRFFCPAAAEKALRRAGAVHAEEL